MMIKQLANDSIVPLSIAFVHLIGIIPAYENDLIQSSDYTLEYGFSIIWSYLISITVLGYWPADVIIY